MISLSCDQIHIVRNIVSASLPDTEIYVFGSRANGTAKKHSDLDIILKGNEKIDQKTINSLILAFSESNLPFRVDVLDWHASNQEFRKLIEPQLKPLP
jgi:predicted nucleotidyltransferase